MMCTCLLQESVSDFFWYYAGKAVIDAHGQHNFSKAIGVSKQVFNTLTEYIQVGQLSGAGRVVVRPAAHSGTVSFQGPCAGNQESLAHSRLWDAVVGFLHVFAHMQMTLPQVQFIHVEKELWTVCNILQQLSDSVTVFSPSCPLIQAPFTTDPKV